MKKYLKKITALTLTVILSISTMPIANAKIVYVGCGDIVIGPSPAVPCGQIVIGPSGLCCYYDDGK